MTKALALTALLIAILQPLASSRLSGQAPPATPIAYINAQRIFSESTIGKAETSRYQAAQQQRAAELRARQEALDATRKQLAQAADGAARVKLQQQEQQQRTELERSALQSQTELQAMQRKVQDGLQVRVRAVLDQMAKERGLQLVVSGETAVVWGAPNLDLTSAVLERMNTAGR